MLLPILLIQIRSDFLDGLEWAIPELLVSNDDSAQPCADPGCEPFPYCCRVNMLSHDQTPALATLLVSGPTVH